MRRGGRPTAESAAEITTRIVQVATRAFLDKGYADTGMEQIAVSAGVAKRSLYARFPTKETLFRVVVRTYSDQTLGHLPDMAEDASPLKDRILDGCLRVLEVVLATDVIALERVIVAESVRFPELVASVEAARGQALRYLAGILERGREGEARTSRKKRAAEDPAIVSAGHLWDLVVAPAVRAAVLAKVPCGLANADRSQVCARVDFFLDGYRGSVR
ncbi:TetR/AcrR family transcriptional regulator [Xanthomonas arboricola]|uniref:TetR/AcrR family transcriptional regulator n=1 Tax=Xanthomonas arboricola TaxID=56448 RepID=UPI001C0E96C7|nr:TetR/AcrR family transcriptional regulator [Xanthomonas arboricola]